MPHTEISSIIFNEGRHRLCLDAVGNGQYALVWRGTSVSPDGFIPKPAYFTWEDLGQLLRQATIEEAITREEIDIFVHSLMGL